MLSSQQLLNFGNSNLNFLEDNLLDQDDWKGDSGVFDLMNYDASPSSSSLDSDQTSNTEVSPISLHGDDIDAWLQDGLLQQQSSQLYTQIKEEPPSPPSVNPNEIMISSVTQIPTVTPVTNISTLFQAKPALKKMPIPRVQSSRQKSVTSLNGKIINMTPKVSLGRVPVSSNIVQLKNLTTLPLKTEQLNTAFLPGEKYAIPPKIVKLENGQFYIARSVLKGAANKQAAALPGQKRTAPNITTASITKDYSDLKNVKRQQRMMKNRESASLSRQRKKEHLSTLEVRVSEISAMNAQLKEENRQLKEKVKVLETENTQLKGSYGPIANKENLKKSSTIVMAILLFVIFNPFPLSSKSSDGSTLLKPHVNTLNNNFRSRALLQYDNSNNIDYDFDVPFKRKPLRNMVQDTLDLKNFKNQPIKFRRRPPFPKPSVRVEDLDEELLPNGSKLFPHAESDCEETFNKTDMNRINKILEGLVKGYDKKESTKKKKVAKKHYMLKKFGIPSKYTDHNCSESEEKSPKPLISPFLNRSKYNRKVLSKVLIDSSNSSQELLNEIQRHVQRKDDTFYVVSMKDFLILPATNHSLQHRPKFSFIVPAFLQTSNDTSMQEFSMLQIDCNVLDTKLVRLDKKIMAKHFLTQLKHLST